MGVRPPRWVDWLLWQARADRDPEGAPSVQGHRARLDPRENSVNRVALKGGGRVLQPTTHTERGDQPPRHRPRPPQLMPIAVTQENSVVADHVYKVVELVGSSHTSHADAIENA